jgi:hypothetical protein
MSLTSTLLCLNLLHLTPSRFSLKIIILAFILLPARQAVRPYIRMASTLTLVRMRETYMLPTLIGICVFSFSFVPSFHPGCRLPTGRL